MERPNPISPLDAVPDDSAKAASMATLATVAFHGALVVIAMIAGVASGAGKQALIAVSEMIEVDLPKEQPEPPPPAVEAESTRIKQQTPDQEAPAPEAAQAAEALTANEDVVDFGDTLVTGTGSAYAGGVTESTGTSTQAVRDDRARAGGVIGGTGIGPAVDRSRPPRLAGGNAWNCPFPEESDLESTDHAVVTLRVVVAKDGGVSSVQIMRDPGMGFGREAKRCALSKRWAPAWDVNGAAIDGVTDVNVRFDR
jgi:protein TonB